MTRLLRRRKSLLTLGVVILVGLGYGGWRALKAYRTAAAMVGIRKQIEQGRHGLAAQALTEMLDWDPDVDEALYLLGLCEKARGRAEAADRAWSHVPAGSRFASSALTGRASLLIDRGRLADAEQLLNRALDDRGIDGFEPRRLLTPLFWQEGRVAEAQQLVEANWETMKGTGRQGSQEAIELVRLHIALRVGTASVEAVRSFLDRAERLAPDDPRIRLGKANLAIRQGTLADAASRLDECLRITPDDVPTWRSKLELARAAGKLEDALAALRHLPATVVDLPEFHRLAAWIAGRKGDHAVERKHLETLSELDPGDVSTLVRLAELAIRDSQPARAEELRRRKAELDRLNEQYRELLLRDQPVRDAITMAELAERLGHPFEAGVFASVALVSDPEREDMRALLARLGSRRRDADVAGQTLADALGAVAGESTAGAEPSRAMPAAPNTAAVAVGFEDDAARAGLVHVFDNGETPSHTLPEVSSGGVGLIDFDGDGWLDVYALQGGPFPPSKPPAQGQPGASRDSRPTRGDRLFRNRRDGTFQDVTESAGLPGASQGYSHGVTVGDFDNDGHPDLFVTRWRSYALYRNRGDGTFEDVTVAAGLGGDRDWPTSAAFADLDNDGDLDLYVCHYLRWDAEHPRLCQNDARTAYTSCDPSEFEAMPDHLFRNDRGRFTDVTAEAGIVDQDGRGFGVIAADIDEDGLMDLLVANDRTANYLFHNRGGLRFEERGLIAGVACNAQGSNQAGMGVAAGDLDGDGKIDLAVTNFHDEATTLFLNLGGGHFVDHTAAIGLVAPSRTRLGFGISFLDANNDGMLDLLTSNGHVNDYRPKVPYKMRAQLMVGGTGGWLTDVTEQAGPPFLIPHIGRGLAIGDLDNDGRVDALLVAVNEPLVYLHNRTAGGHYLKLALEGTKSVRDAVGARVVVEAGGSRRTSQRLGGGSFLSASDPRLHFGLGTAARVDRLEVRWPSGRVDTFQDLPADKTYRLREGAPRPVPAG